VEGRDGQVVSAEEASRDEGDGSDPAALASFVVAAVAPRSGALAIDLDTIVFALKSSRAVTLSWHGKTDLGVPDAPAAPPLERWMSSDGSAVLRGDNLAVLHALAATHAGSITLAYLDPPFLTNRLHEAKDRKTGAERVAFDDRWTDRAAYLEALASRLLAVRALLAPHGSVVIHVDPKTSHYVKVLADEVFGEGAFASEIVWRYRRWPSKTPNFQRVHDVLLRYRKDPNVPPRWNVLYEPLAASTVATWGKTKQRAVFEEGGRRARSSSTEEPTAGVPMGDVWEIGVLAPVSRERTGYPSQKPEALLDRLVSALSDPGDLVLDPYAGSGTTLAVAAKLGRRFVGVDQSEVALETTLGRLRSLGLSLEHRSSPEPRPSGPRAVACAERPVTLTVPPSAGPAIRRAVKRPRALPDRPGSTIVMPRAR
jgi:site-specific DNA-methyltransferase (adenine-specific)